MSPTISRALVAVTLICLLQYDAGVIATVLDYNCAHTNNNQIAANRMCQDTSGYGEITEHRCKLYCINGAYIQDPQDDTVWCAIPAYVCQGGCDSAVKFKLHQGDAYGNPHADMSCCKRNNMKDAVVCGHCFVPANLAYEYRNLAVKQVESCKCDDVCPTGVVSGKHTNLKGLFGLASVSEEETVVNHS